MKNILFTPLRFRQARIIATPWTLQHSASAQVLDDHEPWSTPGARSLDAGLEIGTGHVSISPMKQTISCPEERRSEGSRGENYKTLNAGKLRGGSTQAFARPQKLTRLGFPAVGGGSVPPSLGFVWGLSQFLPIMHGTHPNSAGKP